MARRRVKLSPQSDAAETRSIGETHASNKQPAPNGMHHHIGNGDVSPDLRPRIERLAYQLYEQRGHRHGDDWKDWLEAERLTIAAQHKAE
ncbi:MAG TPA: DUF2934 domain-containing protein [Nitrospiraceae bacterium]|nr:DUF2934 domain-containing protein [Nitrospiraceae bacterium]